MIIHHYTDALTTAKAIAEDIFVRGAQITPLHIAISGGSTPRMLFELIASPEWRERIQWKNIHLYWVDERCVPPTDAQSNYGMTAESLLRHVPLSETQIHRIQGENDPESEALRYTQFVNSHLPLTEGLPTFDVVILGIGDDGHTSSIFPHAMHLLEERTPYVVATHPLGQQRICLTGPTIGVARRVLYHSVGESKQAILQAIVNKSPESLTYPAAYFTHKRTDIELFTDQALDLPL